jgi:hypothetical protein
MKALNIISIFLIILLFSSSAFALTANELQSIKELPVPVDTISEFNLLTRNVDTFFTNLISTKAELDRGEMVFEFNNPFSIPFDASMLTNYYEQSKNLNVESSEMFLLKQKEVITPIYEQILINKTCEYTPYNLNENITPKGELIIEKETPKNITYDCSYYENGKLTENKISYVDEWQPIKEIPAGKSTIKIVYHWQIKLGERAVDIMPSLIIPKSYTDLKISTWEYKATKWTWFNTSWSYKKEINLSGVPANTTNYQQRLVITKETGMNSNYSDLRFTNPTETTSLPYWIETSNASQAIVWLNVSIFNGTVAYLYYGDTSAVSTSNGSNVFLFFDDFNRADSASLGSNWQNVSAGNWSIISNQGYRNHEGTACGSDFAVALVGGVPLNFTDIITQATFNFTVFSGTDVYFGLTSRFLNNCGTDEGYHLVVHNAITNIQLLDGGVAWKTALTTTQALNENWNYELQINGTTINGKLWKVGTTKPTSWTITNTTSSRADGFIGISGQKGPAYHANAYFDNFFARTWIISEPTVTFGTEQTAVSDVVPPIWSNIANNASTSSKVGQNVSFTIKLNDETNLSSYIFSTNNTGTWNNQSTVSISGLEYNATASILANQTRGKTICGLFYVYDAGTNLNTSNTSCFTVADTPPTAPTAVNITPATAYKNSTLNCSVSGGTDADADSITYLAQFMDTNNSTILQSYSSTLTFNCSANANCTHFDTVYCRGMSSTAYANSSANEASKYINNTMPTAIVNVTLNSATNAGSVLNFTGAGCSDIDTDAISYFYQVYNINQSIIRQNFSTLQTYTLQNADIINTLRVTSFCGDAYVNNTANATATVVVLDGTPPTYSNLSNNASSSTNQGDTVSWSVTLSDNYKLSNYIFSTNNTGNWTNDTTVSTANAWCYQESANVSNQTGIDGNCGLNYGGNYTYIKRAISGEIIVFYKTPINATSLILKIKIGDPMFDIQNITLPNTCWSSNNITFNFSSATCYGTLSSVGCKNVSGNNYIDLFTDSNSACIMSNVSNSSSKFLFNDGNWNSGTRYNNYGTSEWTNNAGVNGDLFEEAIYWNIANVSLSNSNVVVVSKIVNQSGGNQVCGKFYFNDTSNNLNETANSCFIVLTSPTSAPAIITPTATAYEGMINISYNASIGNSSISYYNISLLNSNDTFNISIITNNTELFYNWNSSSANNSNWKIEVEAVTVYGEKNSSVSALFSTHNFAVTANISSIVYAGNNATCNFTIIGTDATANLSANVFFYVNTTLADSRTVNVTSGVDAGTDYNSTLFNAGDVIHCLVQPADDVFTSALLYDTAHIAVFGASVSGFGLCTNTSNQTALWIYSKDETTKNALNSTVQFTAQYWITSPSYATNLSTVFSGNSTYRICLNATNTTVSADIYMIYTAGFTERWFVYNGTLSTTNPPNITIYNFANTTDVCKLQLTTRDATTYNYFSNTYGVLQRFYVGNSNETTWTSVQMDKSSDFGVEFFNVVEQTVDYRLLFYDLQNNLIKQTGNMKFLCTSCLCTLNVLMSPYASTASSVSATPTWTYNNATKIANVAWNDGTGSISSVRTLVTKETASQTVTICNTLVSGSIGNTSCNVSAYTGTLHIQVFKNLNATSTISEWIDNTNNKLLNFVGENETTLWGLGIELTLIIAGAMISPVGAIIMMMFGLVVNMLLGMMSFLTATFLIVAGTLSIIIALKVKT